MKRIFLFVFVLLGAVTTISAQSGISRLDLEVRGDWQYDSFDGEPFRVNNSSFQGKFANFRMDGTLAENLTYSIRYRINKVQSSAFAATDWATINYSLDNWDLSAGKQVVAIGGYEYDRAPIDIYFASEYWQHIACYQFGVSAAYKFNNSLGSKLLGQICQSPYDFANEGLYAYNLMYMDAGNLSSLNLLEYAPGKYIGYVALGIREEFGPVALEWDVMDRYDIGNNATSFSTMLDVNWKMNDKLRFFAHGSYDENRAEVMMDPTVRPVTSIWNVGGGVEYFPYGAKNLRIHAASNYVFGKNNNGVLRSGDFVFQMGVTWRLNLIGNN